MSNIDPEVQAYMDAQAAQELQRQRERTGINSAAEAGVFSSAEPPELKLVRERDAWMAEQFDRANRPQDFTAIPVVHEDGPSPTGAATTPRVIAADWGAPLEDGFEIPAATTDVGNGPETQPLPDATKEAARPAMLRGVMVDPASIGINPPHTGQVSPEIVLQAMQQAAAELQGQLPAGVTVTASIETEGPDA